MQKNNFRKIVNIFFDQSLEFQVQIFNLLAIIGLISGVGFAVIDGMLGDSIATVIIQLAIAALSLITLLVAGKKKCYNICSWILVVAVFLVMFSALFFFCGGYKSGAAYIFFIGFTFTAILLNKYERATALVVELILYISCLLIVYFRPETARILPAESDYLFSTILNFTATSVIILIAVMMRTRLSNNHRRQVEEFNRELLARNETLARYDHMKSEFLATVAHEINTPLAVIAASSNDAIDLLGESPLNIDEIIENQVIIEKRVKLIDGILMDLMDIAAIENGRLSLNRQNISLTDLLKSVCDVQFKRLNTGANSLVYDISPGLPKLWADPQRIEQVMTNLLSNACLHTVDGVITVELKQSEGCQIVSVIDTGAGMDAETARVVFREYVSTKADYWRHGIGLPLCRRIIMAHNGDIWVESEKGRGTTISFSLNEESGYE